MQSCFISAQDFFYLQLEDNIPGLLDFKLHRQHWFSGTVQCRIFPLRFSLAAWTVKFIRGCATLHGFAKPMITDCLLGCEI